MTVDQIKEEIGKMFADKTVAQEVTLERLEELAEEVQLLIESLA